MKIIPIITTFLLIFKTGYTQYDAVESHNPHFHSRFQYVTCRFYKINSTSYDDQFSCHLKSSEDGKVYKIFIGANQLYKFLYPERPMPTNEHLYASVGKMLIYDTIYLPNKTINSISDFVKVNEDELNVIENNGFNKNHLSILKYKETLIDCITPEVGYYFDRRYYSAGSFYSAVGIDCFVLFDYDCDNYHRSMPIPDWKDGYYYYYDGKGVLIMTKSMKN